jgi:ribonucleases P/MRP protein subunit RPP25
LPLDLDPIEDILATMEKYRLVQEHKADGEDFLEPTSNYEVRITQQGKPRNYISYAMGLFVSTYSRMLMVTDERLMPLVGMSGSDLLVLHTLQADGSDKIVLKAMGRAINKAVTIAEILKRKMPLHQLNSISSVEMIDVFEPLEEGLDVVTSRRYVSCMKITLSRSLEGIDVNDIGYQAPLPMEELTPGDFHPLREAALIASS